MNNNYSFDPNQQPQDDPNFGAQGPQFQTPPPKKRRSKEARIGWMILGGLVILLFVAAALSPNESSRITTPTSTPSQQVDRVPTPAPTTPAPTVTEPTTTEPEPTEPIEPSKPSMTKSQEQAIGSAESYLELKGFSRLGLIEQLSSEYGEGFSKADATFAVDHITVDWNEQAFRAAKSYLELQHFSRKGLIDQLESPYGEQFTHAQAVYGVTKAGL